MVHDFVLKLLKIIIELDGPQHFIQIMNWKSPKETCKGDIYKMKCANDNGFSVIRLSKGVKENKIIIILFTHYYVCQ